MQSQLKEVTYSQFRNIVQTQAGQKIKNRGKTTYLYDQKNRLLAALKTASIDAFGRTRPAAYYIAA